jgi:flagellar export protein FliJ
MAFRFSLATVLRVRENIEKREERALQSIQLEIARLSRQIENLAAEIANAHIARNTALQKPIAAINLQMMTWQTHAAEDRKTALLQALAALEQKREAQVKAYQAAHRDHETVLNIMREQKDAYEQEQTRAQQKSLDDIFIARRKRVE